MILLNQRIVGNFQGRKLVRVSKFCGKSRKKNFHKILGPGVLWWHQQPIRKSLVWKNFKHPPICESFLPQKFPAIWYCSVTSKTYTLWEEEESMPACRCIIYKGMLHCGSSLQLHDAFTECYLRFYINIST